MAKGRSVHVYTERPQTHTLETPHGGWGMVEPPPHKILMGKQLSLKEIPYHRQIFITLFCI